MAWITGKPGAYRVQWREARGGKVQSSETIRTRGDAEAAKRAKDAELALAEHKGRPSASMPLEALHARWKESRKAARRVRDTYAEEVRRVVGAMAKDMGWKVAADITAESFDRYRTKREGKGTDRPLAMLKGLMRYARNVLRLRVDEALLDMEPARSGDKRVQPPLLTDGQVAAILERAALFGPSAFALLEHLSVYGCRPVDLCRATVGDWDGKRMRYRNTKNGTTQSRPILPAHADGLDRLCMHEVDGLHQRRPDDAALFLAPNGEPWQVDWKGSATQLTSWYRNNIGEKLLIRTVNGEHLGCLAASQTGCYCLKDYGLSRLERVAGRRAAMALSQHKTESAFRRYLATNEQEQMAALALLVDDH